MGLVSCYMSPLQTAGFAERNPASRRCEAWVSARNRGEQPQMKCSMSIRAFNHWAAHSFVAWKNAKRKKGEIQIIAAELPVVSNLKEESRFLLAASSRMYACSIASWFLLYSWQNTKTWWELLDHTETVLPQNVSLTIHFMCFFLK